MSSRRSVTDARPIQIRVPATSGNLGPGFDCLGLAVDLYNEVEAARALRMEVHWLGEGEQDLPPLKENLLVVAYRAAFRRRRAPLVPLSVTVRARIPISRGLGSSAAAIAAGLALARPLLSPALTLQEAAQIGTDLEGHPDNVVPALVGGITAAVADGGQVHWVQLGNAANLHLVALVPQHRLSTKKARGVLPKQVSLQDAVFNLSRAAVLSASLATGNLEPLAAALKDRLHQPYRAPLVPGLSMVLKTAPALGAYGAFLSGAGPTIGVLCSKAKAKAVARALGQRLPTFRSLVLPIATVGAWGHLG